jgi:hypothetical protein
VSELTPLGGWLHQAERFVRRFVVLSDDQACAIVLWTAHTHGFSIAVATPYLSVSSAEKESGKTRLLEVLRILVANPWFTGRTTTAALTRKVDKMAPTLLLDEGDPAFNGDKDYAETLRGVLNTGYRVGGAVTVCVGQGAKLDVRDLSTFCPKAIAGIGALPDTVQSRSIPIRLKKRLATEPVERFRERTVRDVGEKHHDALEASVKALLGDLELAEPELPDELSDRAQDVWEPLLAIAEAAGGEWPTRARKAAVRLSRQREPEDATVGVRLLADIRTAFGEDDRVATSALLEALNGMEDAPWGDWHGRPLSAHNLGKLLSPFEIKSRTVRFPGNTTAKGYLRKQFDDAWERYIPCDPSSEAPHRHNRFLAPETALSEPSHGSQCDGYEHPEKPRGKANVTDVTAAEGGCRDTDSSFGNIGPNPVVSPPRKDRWHDHPPAEENEGGTR